MLNEFLGIIILLVGLGIVVSMVKQEIDQYKDNKTLLDKILAFTFFISREFYLGVLLILVGIITFLGIDPR